MNQRGNLSRRSFLARAAVLSAGSSLWPSAFAAEASLPVPDPLLKFPGPWSFQLPHGAIILVSDQQLTDLQEPDREVDLSITSTPNRTTLRKVCQQLHAQGARKLIVAFDHFWAQYRSGQGTQPRRLMPDTDEYIQHLQKLSETARQYGLGFELSLLSPLELGPGYARQTGESGQWVQYREGLRDPKTGRFEVQLWEHRLWTNNKGSIDLKRLGARAFAFRERPLNGTPYYAVNPSEIVELKEPPLLEEWEAMPAGDGRNFRARRLTVRGQGDPAAASLDRVLVVVKYQTPEIDYFSSHALPFLKNLVTKYHQAGIPLVGLYSDEMHIQQDWVYRSHHDEGQFTFRYLTPGFAERFAAEYGAEFGSFEKFLVYFCYAQHGFLSTLEAGAPAQHVLGESPDEIQRTFLLRRRYYELLSRTVVGLFAEAKTHAEELYGHPLEARAHATWAQSPTIDFWDTGQSPHAPKQYEYTPNFIWGNTVQQAAAACDDYFRWNDFLTGGGNDHTEGGWLDRNYYALALGCSTGILNKTPYAYAAHWGMPHPVAERRQALVDAYGAAAGAPFQAVQDSQHRDIEVLMLYPISLVACEERFGSWMTQYGYANYVTADALLRAAQISEQGEILMAGRRFTTLVALFEPLPPPGLIPFMEDFVSRGGKLIWSGPPPRLDLAGALILERWQKLCGIEKLGFAHQGRLAPGEQLRFEGVLGNVPPQTILTSFRVDHVYPVEPAAQISVVARLGRDVVGVHRPAPSGGSATYLGCRPRDDQAASLGYEVRTWFEILRALGAYPGHADGGNDNPSVVSRSTPYLACRFPNGTVTIAVHYRDHVESWPGGFHRDPAKDELALARNPLPSDRLNLADFAVAGLRLNYTGRLVTAIQLGAADQLVAFAGYDCAQVQVNGTEHRFADHALAHIAWAPVLPDRRVAGGALLEIWAAGQGEVRVPMPQGALPTKMVQRGARVGLAGPAVPCEFRGGHVHFSCAGGRLQHLYLL